MCVVAQEYGAVAHQNGIGRSHAAHYTLVSDIPVSDL